MIPKKILLTDDISNFSTSGKRRTHQLRHLAANMCKSLGAELHFLYVEDVPDSLRKKKFLSSIEKRNPKLVTSIKNDLASLCENFQVHFDMGSPAEKILSWAKKINPEIIILGTRGAKGLEKLLLGSVAEEIVRHSATPIVVVGPNVKKVGFTSLGHNNRILLLTDLTTASKPAENFVAKISKLTNARVTILHSVGDSIMHIKRVYYGSSIPIYPEVPIKEMKTQARSELSNRSEQFKKKGISVQTLLVTEERDIINDIKRELDDDYDLLVMGTHTRNRLLQSFLGSTARESCLLSTVPVVIVRSR